jgi:hypothetical protein
MGKKLQAVQANLEQFHNINILALVLTAGVI